MNARTVALAFLAAACAAPAPAQTPPASAGTPVLDEPTTGVMEIVDGWSTPPAGPAPAALSCSGVAVQGGAVLCRTRPGARLLVNGRPAAIADAEGVALVGFAREQDRAVTVELAGPVETPIPFAPKPVKARIELAGRTDPVSRFRMDCAKIEAQTPEQKRHVETSWVKKDEALKQMHPPAAPVGFIKPTAGPYSSPFGAVRTYVPATAECEGRTSVHYGLDVAAPTGTPIVAPMAGTVILADPDLYYEGGAVFLDHGRGLVSLLMHMSRVDVKAGDRLKQGDPVGLVGATGRVTGPHLHWSLKHRNETTGKREDDVWLDPALLLGLGAAAPAVGGDE